MDRGCAVALTCEAGLLHRTDRRAQFLGEISGSWYGAHLLHQRWPLPPDSRGQLLGRPRRTYHPTMITEVPFEYAGDRWHRKANERALVRIESLAGFDESSTRHLEEVLLVLAAMCEPPRQRFSQPEMGNDDLVKDLLTSGRTCRLGFQEQLMRTFGESIPRGLLAR